MQEIGVVAVHGASSLLGSVPRFSELLRQEIDRKRFSACRARWKGPDLNEGLSFVLSGSSARQLERGNANLLGGRAWSSHLFPLTSQEVVEVDLLLSQDAGRLQGGGSACG